MDLRNSGRLRRSRGRIRADSDIRRDICEEHIEELAILWRLRVQQLGSPEHRLIDLVRLDERLDAHADAVVAAGESAAKMLEAGFGSDDATEVFASAYLALRSAHHRFLPSLREFVGRLDTPLDALDGLRDALVHVPGSAWLDIMEPHRNAPTRAGAVAAEVFAFRGAPEVGESLLPWILAHEEDSVRAFGWRAAAHGVRVPDRAWRQGFEDSCGRVRSLALVAAAWQGNASGIRHLRNVAQRESTPDETSLLVLAWLAEGDDYRTVLTATRRLPTLKQQAHVLSALGHPSVISMLIEMLTDNDPRTASASALALTRVTGWDVDSQRTATVIAENAPAGDEVAEAFDEVLVLPDPDRARARWKTDERRFVAGTRWSRGIDVSSGLPREGLRQVDLESLRACCLRTCLGGAKVWSAARLEAFPQPRV